MAQPTDLAIWWLSPWEMTAIGDEPALPPYLHSEYRSLLGRNPRGRLWTPREIDIKEIEWVDGAIGDWCQKCGGIVFWRKDLETLRNMPGLITDLSMKRLQW